MKKLVCIVVGALAIMSGANASFGQNRALGARTMVLDDGAGNTITLQSAAGATGTFTFPNGGGTLATQSFLSGNYLPLAGGSITGTLGIGVAQSASTGLTITEPPGGAGGKGGMVINNTDVVGGSFPLVINQNTTGLTWSETATGTTTEGRMLRLNDGTQIYDFGITQSHNFFLGNGLGISGQLISATGGGNVSIPNGSLTVAGNVSANGVTVGSAFTLNSSGNITKLNNVTTSFPAVQGGAGTVLTNNGSGSLSWQSPGGFTPTYFNAYTNSAFATVPPGGEVPVTTISALSGFVSDGFGGFTASATGVYNVEYTVAKIEAGGFALMVNGVVLANSKFSCATGTTVIHGSALVTLSAGDILKLVASPDNASSITLELTPGTPNAVEASMTAIQIH